MFLIMPSLLGVGAQLPNIDVPCYVRGGSKVVGQVVEFDFANSDAATTDNEMDGGDNSGFANVIATVAVTSATHRKLYGIVRGAAEKTATPSSTIADDALAIVGIWGKLKALVYESSGASAKNDDLLVQPTVSATALVTEAGATTVEVEFPIVGKMLDTLADADPAVLSNVLFSGWLPFGVRQAPT